MVTSVRPPQLHLPAIAILQLQDLHFIRLVIQLLTLPLDHLHLGWLLPHFRLDLRANFAFIPPLATHYPHFLSLDSQPLG